MVMAWIWTGMILISILTALVHGKGAALAAAAAAGAQGGITLAISMAGAICLWSGVGELLQKTGFTALLSRGLQPVLNDYLYV